MEDGASGILRIFSVTKTMTHKTYTVTKESGIRHIFTRFIRTN